MIYTYKLYFVKLEFHKWLCSNIYLCSERRNKVRVAANGCLSGVLIQWV